MFFTFSFETTGKMREFFRLSMTFRERCCCQSCAQIQSHTSTAGCGRNLKCFLMVTHGGRKNPVRINIVADEYETFKSHLTQNVTSQLFFFFFVHSHYRANHCPLYGKNIYTSSHVHDHIKTKTNRMKWRRSNRMERHNETKPIHFRWSVGIHIVQFDSYSIACDPEPNETFEMSKISFPLHISNACNCRCSQNR